MSTTIKYVKIKVIFFPVDTSSLPVKKYFYIQAIFWTSVFFALCHGVKIALFDACKMFNELVKGYSLPTSFFGREEDPQYAIFGQAEM